MPETAVLDETTADSQTSDDVATSDETQTPTDGDATAADEPTVPEEVSSGLITEADYAKVKDDPTAFRKAILKGFTQKTQTIAAERKSLGAWGAIRDAITEDPKDGLSRLAREFGFEIHDPKAAAAATVTQTAGDEAETELRTVLAGVGLEEIADKLAPVMRKIAEGATGKTLEPLRTQQQQLIDESTQREAKAALDAFGAMHPDWKEHETAMNALAEKHPAGKNVTAVEWMETLYFLATRESSIEKAAQAKIDKMTKAAGTAERRSSTVADARVSHGPPKHAGFKEAAAAALRGERWD